MRVHSSAPLTEKEKRFILRDFAGYGRVIEFDEEFPVVVASDWPEDDEDTQEELCFD